MTDFLITGGTGSFGRAFVTRLLTRTDAGRIAIYSRDEAKQWRMRQDFRDHPRLRFFIGDVRDQARLRRAFSGIDVVVHAAALKRIEVGAYNPLEMVKTNVIGAMNVVEAAMDAGVEKVVALSTDKAYQPISPYGQSKALAEAIFLSSNNARGVDGPHFAVTRYGNVAGSNGSVIPLWRELIDRGEHVTVTDHECTRFWMDMSEAVDLVFSAINAMPQDPLIPLLPAYRLDDLLTAMGVVDFIEIGLPTHEKLHECMALGNCSNTARRLTVDELRERLKML